MGAAGVIGVCWGSVVGDGTMSVCPGGIAGEEAAGSAAAAIPVGVGGDLVGATWQPVTAIPSSTNPRMTRTPGPLLGIYSNLLNPRVASPGCSGSSAVD